MQQHQLDSRITRMLDELKKLTVRRSVFPEGIEIADHDTQRFHAFTNGGLWGEGGEWWDFHCRLTVPEGFGVTRVRIRTGREGGWDAINPQFEARLNGRMEQAFDVNHCTMLLSDAMPGRTYDLLLNGYTKPTPKGEALPMFWLSLEDVDTELLALCYDIAVPHEAALLLPEGNREREVTLEILARAIDTLDIRDPYTPAFDASVVAARALLKTEYYDKRASLPAVATAECIGHTHIDVAWQWDLYQTRHKAVRSFATVLKLMEQYPNYKFMSSQPALYNMVKQDEPDLYARIKQAVAEGRWEPEGGMWLEPDCNLISGESMARQLLVGQTFFIKEFGKKSRILWLPDVFGYSAALPQLLKLADIDYFMTTKLSWSEFNLFPYDTFTWQGVDGSEVLTHFSPSREFSGQNGDNLPYYTTYNAQLRPNEMAGGWQRFQQKGLDDHFLVSFGYGDGGGGPTDWMLENQKRMETPMPGTPVTEIKTARSFFEDLEKRVSNDPRLPKWAGELYLEYHRGTYTAIAKNKRNNRKIELLLREVELWRAYAAQLCGLAYPAERLNAIWQDVLTLQFHDILPGSSIKKVYDDSDAMYAAMFPELLSLKAEAIAALAGQTALGDVLAFNSLSEQRSDVVRLTAPEGAMALLDAEGATHPIQLDEGRACAYIENMKPMTATGYHFTGVADAAPNRLHVTREGFDTPFYTGVFDAAMGITSLIDKRSGRQIVKPGQALNRLVCYENKPHNYDAWDINIYYSRHHFPVDNVTSVELISQGPVLARLRVKYAYMHSTITQDILLYNDLPRIEFETTVDWHEKQYLLKAHFPVDVFYNEATYDIQYGNVRRATHKNTTWDVARFETCAHKWVDVSEDGYGVALLNDCKYGHSIDENGIALTLLKSSTFPNPEGDQEMHHFTYALLPHQGGWREAQVPQRAYELNIPVTMAAASGKDATALPLSTAVDAPNVIIEAVKQAEDGNGTIVRLYEYYGRRTQCTLSVNGAAMQECNLLEESLSDQAPIADGRIPLTLRPYQVLSLRITQ